MRHIAPAALVTLRGLLRAVGTGAPSSGRSTGIGAPSFTLTHTPLNRLKRSVGSAGLIWRRWSLLGLLLLGSTAAALVFFSPAAHAARLHILERSLGTAGSGAGQLALAAPVFSPGGEEQTGGSGVAVNATSHHVYVADTANHRIDEFDPSKSPSERFVRAWGWGVSTGAEELQVCTATCRQGLAGSGAGEFQTPTFIAVDNSPGGEGDLYVGDTGNNLVSKFSSEGAVVPTWGNNGPLETPNGQLAGRPGELFGLLIGVAVDVSGNLWVDDGAMSMFQQGGVFSGITWFSGGVPSGIAVDSEDNLYVADGFPDVRKFTFEGTLLGELFDSKQNNINSTGLALDAATGKLYVDEGSSVGVVNPGCPPPSEGCAIAESFGSPQLTGGAGVAVDSQIAGVPVYVADTTNQRVDVFALEPPSAPTVESEFVSQVTDESAGLRASIDPHGVSTDYHFEYGRCATPSTCATSPYETSAPVPDAIVGAGFEVDSVGPVQVQGLLADTAYHYRVVASNELGEARGADQVFTTQGTASVALADGRGYELVSPPNKHGVALEALSQEGAEIQAAEDGHAVTYFAKGPISSETEGSRSSVNTQLLSTRGGAGWGTVDVSTPHEDIAGVVLGTPSEYLLFSGDLSVGAVEPSGATPLAPALMGEHGERTPYRREANGQYTPLVTASNTPAGVKFGGEQDVPGRFSQGVEFVSMTPDASKIVLQSHQPLTEGFSTGGLESLYEWSAGHLQLVSVLPNGKAAAEEGLTALLGNADHQMRGALSDDGSRVVFATQAPAETHLFVRDVVRGESVQLDVPAAGVKPGPGAPLFQIATGDGSRVFFTDVQRLTTDSTAQAVQPDLYMCDVSLVAGHLSCSLRDLTVDANGTEAANVQGDVIGLGAGGRLVYFVANGALASGATPGACTGLPPYRASASVSCNLYVRDVDAGVTSLVAVVSARDSGDWRATRTGGGDNLQQMTSGVSSSGRFLAFVSSRALTGFDNRDARSGELDAEVFEFDREHGSLQCVSCDASGARPAGVYDPLGFESILADRQKTWDGEWLAGSLPGWTASSEAFALYRSRYLSDSGRLFFNSPVGLVSSDSNGREDVYEFEPQGVGGCTLPSGCVALMSGGSSNEESVFFDASVSGNDVFFLTAAKLAPQDTDSALDVYDAHVCTTSIPCPSGAVSVPPPCSTADSCRSAPALQPDLFGPPASSTFNGEGNPSPPPAGNPGAGHLTRAQQLARALKVCRHKPKRKRASCRASAKKRYGHARTAATHRASTSHANNSGRVK